MFEVATIVVLVSAVLYFRILKIEKRLSLLEASLSEMSSRVDAVYQNQGQPVYHLITEEDFAELLSQLPLEELRKILQKKYPNINFEEVL